jgi:hypothetical protein
MFVYSLSNFGKGHCDICFNQILIDGIDSETFLQYLKS